MSQINRKQLRKMLLREFKMLGMVNPDVGMAGESPFPSLQPDYGHEDKDVEVVVHGGGTGSKGTVSKEDCCKAVLCLIECCEDPETKQLITECCDDILSRC
tara:strand:+ start:69 stop:371 length:303 start_codon:yes stop_codon:yes gene_type:complete